ncbi:Flp family type IVb pilin [Kocuria sp. CPCC 205292]|uniref:Flp family type IVb pilin n=1 Tax=Kocuria TaxID=57493 RepID=UPI0034D5238A
MLPLFITIQTFFTDTIERIERNEKGATAVEYGLLLGLVAIVLVGAIAVLKDDFTAMITNIGGQLPG